MWYVMQVRTGTEKNIQIQCVKKISDTLLERCFIPYYEERKRIGGRWITQRRVLFPGYVFLVTEQITQLYEALKNVIGMTRLIGNGDEIVSLSDEEIDFLESLGGKQQVVRMSEGIIVNSKVEVLSGPLQGKEGYIRKIDRHKCKAYLEIPMFGRVQRVQMGIEIKVKIV